MTPSSNPLLNLPAHKEFHIPVRLDDDLKSAYLKQLKLKFSKVYKQLDKINRNYFGPALKKDILKRVDDIQQFILEVVTTYLEGYPSLAYEIFDSNILKFGMDKELSGLQQIQIPRNHSFFRLQVQRGVVTPSKAGKSGWLNYKKPLDLFHPPFQKRRSVSTSRFSISGYPSLYLSENLQTSYSECFLGASYGAFHAISFKNNRPLYFVDLSEDKLKDNALNFSGITSGLIQDASFVIDHLGIYQLIIACHTKIDYIEAYQGERLFFKAEYIIPQLMLQWLKLHGFAIDGIRYKSCTSEGRFPTLNCHYNYILPVKNSLEKGFCPTLASLFTSTKVYSYLKSALPSNLNDLLQDITDKLVHSPYNQITK